MAVSVKSCGGGGLSSTDVTASSSQVLAGYTALTTDSNDEAMQGVVNTWEGEKDITRTLNEHTWTEINTLAPSGASYWAVGDTKTGTYINSEEHSYRIVEFKHSGDAGNITFEQVNLMATASYFNGASWQGSGLKTTIDAYTIETTLDEAIKASSKPCGTSASDSTLTQVSSKLWIMSEKEIAGTTNYSLCKSEGTEYAYYVNAGSTGASRMKYRGTTPDSWYWLRSPHKMDDGYARIAQIQTNGEVCSFFNVGQYRGHAPCFCI